MRSLPPEGAGSGRCLPPSMTTDAPDTIVLVHGFWVTPRSWEDWIDPLRGEGLHGRRAGLPRLRGRGRGAQRRPDPDRRVTAPAIIEHLDVGDRGRSTRRRSSWATRPAARSPRCCSTTGFGAAGVALNSAPTEGVKVVPLSQAKSTFPVLKNPANHHKAVGLTFEQWNYAFTNTFPEERSRAAVRALPHPRVGPDPLEQRAGQLRARATRTSGSTTRTTTGRRCCSSPAPRTTSCRRRSSSRTPSTTSRTPSPRSRSSRAPHLLPAQDGWEEVADYALDWALDARPHGVGGRRVTRPPAHPHRRPDGPDRGRRAGASCPTPRSTRPAGPTVRLGHVVDEVAGPGVAAADLGPIDVVLLTHDHHADNLDDAGRALLPARPTVVTTTVAGAHASAVAARGLDPWDDDRSRHPDRPAITIDRDAVPPRPAAEPADRRRRGRVRARVGGPGRRRAVDLGRHRALRRRAGGRRAARRRRRDPAPRRRAVRRSPGRPATR